MMANQQRLHFENDSLDVDGFLGDLAVHLRRKDLRPLLSYLSIPPREVDDLLHDSFIQQPSTDRGTLTSSGYVVDDSSNVNFLEQRKKIIYAWWQYAANTNYRPTPSQQKIKVIEPKPSLSLPGIKEEGETFLVSRLPSSYRINNSAEAVGNKDDDAIENVMKANSPSKENADMGSMDPLPVSFASENIKSETVYKAEVLPPVTSGPIVQIPTVEMSDSCSQTNDDVTLPYVMYASKKPANKQTDYDVSPRDVTINDSGVTLEDNLKKLWRCLQSCGLKRIVDEMQQRWMIRLDTHEGKADMFPKMTWGTPPPPQTPFTYPPYKKIGHMAVMGSPISLENKLNLPEDTRNVGDIASELNTPRGVTREAASHFLSRSLGATPRAHLRSSETTSVASSMDTSATSFPAREAWKMRTDTVKRQGGTVAVHVMVDNVTFPAHLSTTWGSSLNVTSYQMRERAARVFLAYIMREGRELCKCVDRMERIRGLVVERVMRRIAGVTTSLTSSVENIGSEIIMICRCLYPETVEQLWLWYQSGQLRESVQASFVTKRACDVCTVEQIRMNVAVTEEEYRRALGLLRRKPMPNTKTGRYYVTSGSGGVVGGKSGLVRAQRQAMLSVTRFLKLPIPSPIKQIPNQPFSTPVPIPSKAPFQHNGDIILQHKVLMGGKRVNPSKGLMEKILNKEVLSIRQRVRMCEDEWCEFASRDLNVMLRCARHVMQRRIQGSRDNLSPKCQSLNLLRALHHALMSRVGTSSTAATPRGQTLGAIGNSFISLNPTEVTFSHVDLLSTADDDEAVIKARKQEERDFASAFTQYSDLISELSRCRNNIQEKIINRLTTNATVAHSKQLYTTKDIYALMERWRNLVKKDFNFANDIGVQNLSAQILSDEVVDSSFHRELKLQFPGFIGLLPAIFQVADQVLEKLQHLLTTPQGSSVASSFAYPNINTRDGGRRTISVRLTV